MTNQAVELLRSYDGPKFRIMEVCGTHTHEIFRQGVRNLLSPQIDLISGPGCPVCVTPVDYIDEAVMLALEHHAVICTFGDLVRVPGTKQSLAQARGNGAAVQVVYSPQDAAEYAREHPDRQVVFLSVGFETTVPSSCIAVQNAIRWGLDNFSLLTANKTMPVAYEAMRDACDAYLYPGHVHAIIGTGLCEEMKERGVSGVLAGFTARELVTALAVAVTKFQTGEQFFENCYPRVVKPEGNRAAVEMINRYMEPCDAEWRGLGVLPGSGLALRPEYAPFDARKKFDLPKLCGHANPACRCGDVLRGVCRPTDCKVFGTGCTPEHPVGACMVSGEGACSAWYLYGGVSL